MLRHVAVAGRRAFVVVSKAPRDARDPFEEEALPMAGWGDDPELDTLRQLIDGGWEVSEIREDPDATGGPSDTVVLTKDGETKECTSDHLAFHRFVEYLQEQQRG